MADFTSLIAQSCSHYRILKQIGAGSMGAVYEAKTEYVRINRFVALKFLAEELAYRNQVIERFQRFALNLYRKC